MKYAGFWRRLLAVLIDTLVLMPFIALFLWLDSLSRTVAIAIAIPTAVLFWAYDFYLHGRYGQTVGKMVARIQVRRLDGSPIGWREAFLRSSVDFAFAVILTVGGVYGLCGVSAYEYEHIGWLKLNEYLAAFRPVYYEPVDKMQSVWFLSEVVVLLFNRKKRALHDFIAGTVVAHKASIPDTLPVKADDEVEVLEPRTGRKGTLKNLALAVGLGLFLNIGLQPTMVHWGGLIRGEQSVVLGVIAVAAMFIGYSARYWVAGLSAGLLSTRRRPLWNITGGVVLVVGMLAFFAVRHALAWAFTPEENTPRFRPFHGPSRSLVGEMTLRLLYEDPRYIDTSWSSLWQIIKTELLYGATGIVFGLILHPAVLLVRRVHANPRGRIALYGTTSVTALAIVIFLSIPSREKVTGMAPKVVIEFHLVKPEAMTAVPTGLPSDLAKLLEEGSLTVTVRVRSDGTPAPPLPQPRKIDIPDIEFVKATIHGRDEVILIRKNADLTILDTEIERAWVEFTASGLQVFFELNDKATERMHKFSKDKMGHRIAIRVDGRVMSAPTIAGEVFGRGAVSGMFTHKEAVEISRFLTGEIRALPKPAETAVPSELDGDPD